MKSSRAQIHGRFNKVPTPRFDDRKLTSYSGVIVFMAMFRLLDLKTRLRSCFCHLKSSGSYGMPVILMMMTLHVILGFRLLRSIDYYRDDALLRHLLGLRTRLPDVSTVSRNMGKADQKAIKKVLGLLKEIFYERIVVQGFSRLTIDFDGSVLWTRGRFVEGTAVGYCKARKGARSYYPLLCTCAQTGQVVDMLFRPGNVHDSNGAIQFIMNNIAGLKDLVRGLQIECRFDGAFFDQKLLGLLDALGVEFTIKRPVRTALPAQGHHRSPQALEAHRRDLVVLRATLEGQELGPGVPVRLHPAEGRRAAQGPSAARAVRAPGPRARVQGHRDQQDLLGQEGADVPQRARIAGGDHRRAQAGGPVRLHPLPQAGANRGFCGT